MPASRVPLLRPRRADRRDAARRAALAGTAAVAAATGVGALAAASARRATRRIDEPVRARAAAVGRSEAVRAVVTAPTHVGSWWGYVPAALGVAAYVLRARGHTRRGRAGAGAVALAGTAAALLEPVLDRWLPQPPAPPGHADRHKPVFPSGHTFGPGAVALSSAYVLAREGLALWGAALPSALAVPLVTAGGKLLEQKHWASDIAGGYLAALAVAGACCAGYESVRAR